MSKKIIIEFISINKDKSSKEEYFSIDSAEFDDPKDAVAFWEGLPKDRRITEEEDLPYIDKENSEQENYV